MRNQDPAKVYDNAEYRSRTNDTSVIEHDERYRGHLLRVVSSREPAGVVSSDPSMTVSAWVDGRIIRTPPGNLASIIAAVRAAIDRRVEDAELLPRLLDVLSTQPDRPTPTGDPVQMGSPVWLHAFGYWRRGLVIGLGRSRVTVAYTTPSSMGRIYRRTQPHEQLSW